MLRVCLRFSLFLRVCSAFILLSLCLLSFAYPLACLVCFLYPCGFLWVCRCFLFPFGRTGKKKGRKVFSLRPPFVCCGLLYLRIAAAFLSATAAALWHSSSEPKNGGMCGNSGIKTIKQFLKGCFSIFANLNDFITWKFFLSPFRLFKFLSCCGLY